MGAAVRLRGDFDDPSLRALAKRSRNGAQARRLLALAEIYDGARRTDAGRFAGVGLQIIRDWVICFNAEGPDGLIDLQGSGPPSRLNDAQRALLRMAVEDGPKPYVAGVVCCFSLTWLNGYGTTLASASADKRWGGNCA